MQLSADAGSVDHRTQQNRAYEPKLQIADFSWNKSTRLKQISKPIWVTTRNEL